jgi:hypothetical protein
MARYDSEMRTFQEHLLRLRLDFLVYARVLEATVSQLFGIRNAINAEFLLVYGAVPYFMVALSMPVKAASVLF